MAYTVVTSRDRPDLVDAAAEAFRQRWPEFIFHDPIPPRYMPRVHQYFPEYDILLLDQGQVAAGGWGVPFAYNGRLDDLPEGYDAALVRAVQDHESGRTPTAFSFMAAAVNPAYDKKDLAAEVLSRLPRAGGRGRFGPRLRAGDGHSRNGSRLGAVGRHVASGPGRVRHP